MATERKETRNNILNIKLLLSVAVYAYATNHFSVLFLVSLPFVTMINS